ncbi:MAG: hypothetical protein AAGA48_02920 [Myxococcota bacterium]
MVILLLGGCVSAPVVPVPFPTDTNQETGNPDMTGTTDTAPTPKATAMTGQTGQTGETGLVRPPLRVFATSAVYDGNLQGTVGADVICNDHAQAAGLDGLFRAWLSVSGQDVTDRLPGSDTPYERTDGVRIAENFSEFTTPKHAVAIDRDELGQAITDDIGVWTATTPTGQASGQDCIDWTSNLSFQNGVGGVLTRSDAGWTSGNTGDCDDERRLYCVEMADEDVVKDVFVTSMSYDGDLGGIRGGDIACNRLARDSASPPLDGVFRAWLSTEAADAPSSRFRQFAGEYSLLGGTDPIIASDWVDLVDGDLARAIDHNEHGQEEDTAFGNVWTGTNDAGNAFPSANCLDWTIGGNAQKGRAGSTSSASTWSSANTAGCNVEKRLYCFQQ